MLRFSPLHCLLIVDDAIHDGMHRSAHSFFLNPFAAPHKNASLKEGVRAVNGLINCTRGIE